MNEQFCGNFKLEFFSSFQNYVCNLICSLIRISDCSFMLKSVLLPNNRDFSSTSSKNVCEEKYAL